ncbi:MAG: DNA mobilization endonuclease VirD1/MobC family subunit [Ahrensia sp.]|nr:DNA mobilization endonuclease VirD1/MobC family subunit [Ahrensia sp.]
MAGTVTRKTLRSQRKQEAWKGSAPHRGKWKATGNKGDSDATGFVTVSVKMRPAEREEFKRVCKALGVTPNRAMRTMVRRSAGFLETGNPVMADLATITRQISGVSTNINQIAKAANRTREPDYQAFLEDRLELGAHLSRLEDIIREIVNVGRRRSDGLRRLEELMESA